MLNEILEVVCKFSCVTDNCVKRIGLRVAFSEETFFSNLKCFSLRTEEKYEKMG
jgi:hypothetical protein